MSTSSTSQNRSIFFAMPQAMPEALSANIVYRDINGNIINVNAVNENIINVNAVNEDCTNPVNVVDIILNQIDQEVIK